MVASFGARSAFQDEHRTVLQLESRGPGAWAVGMNLKASLIDFFSWQFALSPEPPIPFRAASAPHRFVLSSQSAASPGVILAPSSQC